jgi:hypothetical protein
LNKSKIYDSYTPYLYEFGSENHKSNYFIAHQNADSNSIQIIKNIDADIRINRNNRLWAIFVAGVNLDSFVKHIINDDENILLERNIETLIILTTLNSLEFLKKDITECLYSTDMKYYKISKKLYEIIKTITHYNSSIIDIMDLEFVINKYDGSSWLSSQDTIEETLIFEIEFVCFYRTFE